MSLEIPVSGTSELLVVSLSELVNADDIVNILRDEKSDSVYFMAVINEYHRRVELNQVLNLLYYCSEIKLPDKLSNISIQARIKFLRLLCLIYQNNFKIRSYSKILEDLFTHNIDILKCADSDIFILCLGFFVSENSLFYSHCFKILNSRIDDCSLLFLISDTFNSILSKKLDSALDSAQKAIRLYPSLPLSFRFFISLLYFSLGFIDLGLKTLQLLESYIFKDNSLIMQETLIVLYLLYGSEDHKLSAMNFYANIRNKSKEPFLWINLQLLRSGLNSIPNFASLLDNNNNLENFVFTRESVPFEVFYSSGKNSYLKGNWEEASRFLLRSIQYKPYLQKVNLPVRFLLQLFFHFKFILDFELFIQSDILLLILHSIITYRVHPKLSDHIKLLDINLINFNIISTFFGLFPEIIISLFDKNLYSSSLRHLLSFSKPNSEIYEMILSNISLMEKTSSVLFSKNNRLFNIFNYNQHVSNLGDSSTQLYDESNPNGMIFLVFYYPHLVQRVFLYSNLLRNNDYEIIENIIKKMEITIEDYLLVIYFGISFYERKQYDVSRRIFEHGCKSGLLIDPLSHFYLGLVYFDFWRYNRSKSKSSQEFLLKSLEFCKKSLFLDFNFQPPAFLLACILSLLDFNEIARDIFLFLEKDKFNIFICNLYLGHLYFNINQLDIAEKMYSNAVSSSDKVCNFNIHSKLSLNPYLFKLKTLLKKNTQYNTIQVASLLIQNAKDLCPQHLEIDFNCCLIMLLEYLINPNRETAYTVRQNFTKLIFDFGEDDSVLKNIAEEFLNFSKEN